MNTPVNFETAKLLKEKGFDVPVRTAWYVGGVAYWKIPANHNESNVKFSAPTIAEVVMWLYEKHSLWILPIPTVTGHFAYKILDVQLDPENKIERPPYTGVSAMDYNSPTEAYEAAIEYCLTNLIKKHGKEKM